jgi:hypothetical protein
MASSLLTKRNAEIVARKARETHECSIKGVGLPILNPRRRLPVFAEVHEYLDSSTVLSLAVHND